MVGSSATRGLHAKSFHSEEASQPILRTGMLASVRSEHPQETIHSKIAGA